MYGIIFAISARLVHRFLNNHIALGNDGNYYSYFRRDVRNIYEIIAEIYPQAKARKGRKENNMANAKYFLKRFAMALLTIFLVACLTFLLMNAVPGSPWLSEKTPSAATLAALNAKYGLDKPLHIQLFMYLKNILHGDFGVSLKMQKNRAVLDIIVDMFPVSAKVGALALLWAIIVGVPLGCLAAFKRGKFTDSLLRVICTLEIGRAHV